MDGDVLNAIDDPSSTATISYSLFQQDFPKDERSSVNTITDGGGNKVNISNSPFMDVDNGDFQLAACSPAIDAGKNSANSSSTDLAGNARKVDDTGVGDVAVSAPVIDMGAFERQQTQAVRLRFLRLNFKSYEQLESLGSGLLVFGIIVAFPMFPRFSLMRPVEMP
ncbi:MAG: choice-of-anchor Q domain-containing protein [Deinococcales bacterium]